MAARYFVGGGTGDWNSTTNWSASDGGASGASFPIAGDDVFLTAASGVNTLTVNTASACTSITCTGFTGTLAGSSNLTVAGNTTLGAGMTNTYTGNLIISATATINTNGIDLYILTTFTNVVTYTLASNIKVTNTWNVNGGVVVYFSGAFTIEVTGNFNCNNSGGSINSLTNNTIILLSGNSTWTGYSGAINTGIIIIGFTININSTTTAITNNFRLSDNTTLNRVAGTVTVTTCNLGLRGSNITLGTNSIQWTNLSTLNLSTTVTLTSDLNIVGNYTNGVITTITGAFNINVGGFLIQTAIINGTGVPATTPTIVLNGTGTWSQTTGHLSTNLTINTTGTITITGTVSFLSGILTHVTATNVVTTGSTLAITGTSTISASGITWNNVTMSGSPTITLGQDLYIGGNLTISTTTTLNGNNVYLSGNFSPASSTITSGTTHLRLTGTQNWTAIGEVRNDVTITGTTTATANITYRGGTFTCTSGTLITTGRSFNNSPSGAVFTTFLNITSTLNAFTMGQGHTCTLLADLNCVNFSALNGTGGACAVTGAFNINVSGTFTTTSSGGAFTLTSAILNLIGNSTWTGGTSATAATIGGTVVINSTTTTITNTIKMGSSSTLTRLGGTVTATGSTLSIASSMTLNTAGMSWDNIEVLLTGTVTINGLLTALGTLTLPNAPVTFAGTHGFTVHTLTVGTTLTATRSYTFVSGITYTVTNVFTIVTASNSFRASFVSSTPGVQAIFTLSPAGSQNVMYTNATDIDSSAGQTIWSFQQVVSNTLNWGNLNVSNIGGGGTFTFAN